jgi:hypothetical protein
MYRQIYNFIYIDLHLICLVSDGSIFGASLSSLVERDSTIVAEPRPLPLVFQKVRNPFPFFPTHLRTKYVPILVKNHAWFQSTFDFWCTYSTNPHSLRVFIREFCVTKISIPLTELFKVIWRKLGSAHLQNSINLIKFYVRSFWFAITLLTLENALYWKI